jgi:hypothetical protein
MRKRANLLLLLCLTAQCRATTASGAPVAITFGRDVRKLQDLVDRRYGRNHIDVTKDYIGARGGDLDPWFWVGDRIGAVWVKVLRRNADDDVVGWYQESGSQAQMADGGGVLFTGAVRPHEEAVVTLPGFRTRFGFYVDAIVPTQRHPVSGPRSGGVTRTQRFFTNRMLNDCGLNGEGAIHAPFDGDVQALMYDVSRWAGPGTWLVCFEDRDTGGSLVESEDGDEDGARKTEGATFGKPKEDDGDNDGHGHERPAGSDNDFYDVVFEVRADGATPAHAVSFGGLKLIYR